MHTASARPKRELTKTLLVADCDLQRARDKDYVTPGEYELYLFGHRRPELYGTLAEETVPGLRPCVTGATRLRRSSSRD